MDVDLRLARPEELAAVGELTAASYLAAGAVPAGSPYLAVLADAAGRAAHAELYVAEDPSGRVVATVTLATAGRPYAEICRPGEVEVRMLAVDPAVQRQGLGAAVVRAVLDLARRRAAERVVLTVLDVNEPAHRLYASLGFSRQPERDVEPVPGVRLQAYRLDV